MEDSNPLFESTCDFIERRQTRRVRAGMCDETTAVFRRSMYGADGAFPQSTEYAHAVTCVHVSWLARFWRWVCGRSA